VHDWKSCGRVNCLVGSNPTLSVRPSCYARRGSRGDLPAPRQVSGGERMCTRGRACAGGLGRCPFESATLAPHDVADVVDLVSPAEARRVKPAAPSSKGLARGGWSQPPTVCESRRHRVGGLTFVREESRIGLQVRPVASSTRRFSRTRPRNCHAGGLARRARRSGSRRRPGRAGLAMPAGCWPRRAPSNSASLYSPGASSLARHWHAPAGACRARAATFPQRRCSDWAPSRFGFLNVRRRAGPGRALRLPGLGPETIPATIATKLICPTKVLAEVAADDVVAPVKLAARMPSRTARARATWHSARPGVSLAFRGLGVKASNTCLIGVPSSQLFCGFVLLG
jgi:hypothetical protein